MSVMWSYEFIRYAFVAGLLASVVCGVIGTYVVMKRLVFLSGGIAHAAFGGLGLAYLCGFSPIGGAWIFSVLTALSVGKLSRKSSQSEDTAMGILWPLGMSLGILFISFSRKYSADLFAFLFGNILMITPSELWLMGATLLVTVAVSIIFFNEFQALCFDEEFARIRGVRVGALYLLLLCLVAMAVVALLRVVGIVLVIALLTIPAAISKQYVRTIKANMVLASVLSFVFIAIGILSSYFFDLPAGASIILVACFAFVVSQFIHRRKR